MLNRKVRKLLINRPILWSLGLPDMAAFLAATGILINAVYLTLNILSLQLPAYSMLLLELLGGIGILLLFVKSLYYDGTKKYMYLPLTCLLSRYYFYLLGSILFCLIIHFSLLFTLSERETNMLQAIFPKGRISEMNEHLQFLYLQFICIGMSICSLLQIASWFSVKQLTLSALFVLINSIFVFFMMAIFFRLHILTPSFSLAFLINSTFLLACASLIYRGDKRFKIALVISPVLQVTVLIFEKIAGWITIDSARLATFEAYFTAHVLFILPVCICSGYKIFIQPNYR